MVVKGCFRGIRKIHNIIPKRTTTRKTNEFFQFVFQTQHLKGKWHELIDLLLNDFHLIPKINLPCLLTFQYWDNFYIFCIRKKLYVTCNIKHKTLLSVCISFAEHYVSCEKREKRAKWEIKGTKQVRTLISIAYTKTFKFNKNTSVLQKGHWNIMMETEYFKILLEQVYLYNKYFKPLRRFKCWIKNKNNF